MARYQLRRPLPVKVIPRRVRRQATSAISATAPATSEQPEAEEPEEEGNEEEEEEGPESPDSPLSSPSTVGASSESEDSESDDDEEPPSPVESGAPPPNEQAPSPGPSWLPTASSGNSSAAISPVSTSSVLLSLTSVPPSVASQTRSVQPAFTVSFSSQGNVAAGPQVPGTTFSSTTTQPASTRPSATNGIPPTNTSPGTQSSISKTLNVQTASSTASPPGSAQSETDGQNLAPQRSSPQEERTMITKGGAAAAITLSIIGALAIVIAAFICLKRRKRRQNQYNQRLADDAFNPGNAGSLHAPETAHVATDDPIFIGGGGGSHLTRSTERSNTLFGAGPYQRPETVSTDRSRSRFPIAPPQPTPNPFADPPLNKAYDVLAGRPRSTTLTDRGSWVKNPFRNPESERFDPFGELQEKARMERRKHLEAARMEAEAERKRQFDEKEKMGLGVPEEMRRKGSGVTIGGVGVLDRSGAGGFRDV